MAKQKRKDGSMPALALNPEGRTRSGMCSAWAEAGGADVIQAMSGGALIVPEDRQDHRRGQFEMARHWFKNQWFVRSVVLTRMAFFHYGFKLTLGGEKNGEKKGLEGWERATRRMYRRYAREAWLDWLVLDNVVGLWRVKGGRPPLVYRPERAELRDAFGNEVLVIRHGLTAEQLRTQASLTEAEVNALTAEGGASGQMRLTHGHPVFGFDVLRREQLGCGFGVPSLKPLFPCLQQLMDLDVGDQQLASACTNVYEQHKMGHEIKTGLHAGSRQNMWKKEKAQAFEKAIKGKRGLIRVTTNFDHEVVYPRPDPKHFEAKRYDAGIQRIALWSMPLGQMLLGKTVNPFLMTMLKQQAILEREYMAEHLQRVLVDALGAPPDVTIRWSNRCFSDPRVAADLLKTGLAAGPVSQGTYLEEAGYDQAEEWDRKEVEAQKPKALTTPIFDAAHGQPKGPGRGSAPGRKPGTRDGEGEG